MRDKIEIYGRLYYKSVLEHELFHIAGSGVSTGRIFIKDNVAFSTFYGTLLDNRRALAFLIAPYIKFDIYSGSSRPSILNDNLLNQLDIIDIIEKHGLHFIEVKYLISKLRKITLEPKYEVMGIQVAKYEGTEIDVLDVYIQNAQEISDSIVTVIEQTGIKSKFKDKLTGAVGGSYFDKLVVSTYNSYIQSKKVPAYASLCRAAILTIKGILGRM